MAQKLATDPLAERLARLDSCAVSDALDRLGLKGSVLGLPPLTGPARITGRVVTVKLKAKGREESARHLGTAAIEAAGPGDVIVIEHRGRMDCAGWGGILSTAAKVRGVQGVILDGACRDIDEARERGFPVFARGPVQVTARGRVVEEAFNVPVEICGVEVHPGDLAIADSSGVVFISAARAEEVLQTAEGIAAQEAEMTKAVLAGRSVVEVMGRRYETMLERR